MPLETTYAVLLKKKLTKYRAQWRESNWMISIVRRFNLGSTAAVE